jgi:DNA-binding LacI/PurR family transcriptional regulator
MKMTEERRPTMEDVARKAGVSRALVSLVFRDKPGASEKTRARVRKAAREIGYELNVAARMLRESESNIIGLMITLRNPFHADIAEKLITEAQKRSLQIMIAAVQPADSQPLVVRALLGYRPAGTILLGTGIDAKAVQQVSASGPCVIIGEHDFGAGVDIVRCDDNLGVSLALDHLLAIGHQRIAFIAGPPGQAMDARRETYLAWMGSNLPAETPRIIQGADTEAGGLQAAAELRSTEDRPSAVLCCNDRCAMGILAGLDEAGLNVPDDISVVGFDDIEYVRYGGLKLTTVRQDTSVLAEAAMKALTTRLRDPDSDPVTQIFPPTLKVRDTTGPPSEGQPSTVKQVAEG